MYPSQKYNGGGHKTDMNKNSSTYFTSMQKYKENVLLFDEQFRMSKEQPVNNYTSLNNKIQSLEDFGYDRPRCTQHLPAQQRVQPQQPPLPPQHQTHPSAYYHQGYYPPPMYQAMMMQPMPAGFPQTIPSPPGQPQQPQQIPHGMYYPNQSFGQGHNLYMPNQQGIPQTMRSLNPAMVHQQALNQAMMPPQSMNQTMLHPQTTNQAIAPSQTMNQTMLQGQSLNQPMPLSQSLNQAMMASQSLNQPMVPPMSRPMISGQSMNQDQANSQPTSHADRLPAQESSAKNRVIPHALHPLFPMKAESASLENSAQVSPSNLLGEFGISRKLQDSMFSDSFKTLPLAVQRSMIRQFVDEFNNHEACFQVLRDSSDLKMSKKESFETVGQRERRIDNLTADKVDCCTLMETMKDLKDKLMKQNLCESVWHHLQFIKQIPFPELGLSKPIADEFNRLTVHVQDLQNYFLQTPVGKQVWGQARETQEKFQDFKFDRKLNESLMSIDVIVDSLQKMALENERVEKRNCEITKVDEPQGKQEIKKAEPLLETVPNVRKQVSANSPAPTPMVVPQADPAPSIPVSAPAPVVPVDPTPVAQAPAVPVAAAPIVPAVPEKPAQLDPEEGKRPGKKSMTQQVNQLIQEHQKKAKIKYSIPNVKLEQYDSGGKLTKAIEMARNRRNEANPAELPPKASE